MLYTGAEPQRASARSLNGTESRRRTRDSSAPQFFERLGAKVTLETIWTDPVTEVRIGVRAKVSFKGMPDLLLVADRLAV